MAIQIKTLDQLKLMRRAGLVVGETLGLMREAIKPGITTNHLNEIAVKNLKANKAKPNFLNYHGFPAVICASVNDEIVHGIPNDRLLQDGDVVSIDFGAIIEGWHGDAAITTIAGTMDGGHGIGTEMHQEPHVLNFGAAGMGPELKVGIALAIEPMITRGSPKTKVLADEWTVVSQDGSRGAHFEHSFALLPDGKPFVLTAIDGGKEKLGALGVEFSSLI